MPKKVPKSIQLSPKARKLLAIACAILVFLFALGMTLYPLVSNWYNSRHQSEIHTQYLEVLQQVDNSDIILAKRSANAYNAAIAPSIQLSDAFSKEALLQASEDYESLLNLTGDGIMGYIEIPLIQVSLPIYHGTDSKTLDIGLGHLLGSSLPVGGRSTHTVLTGHSGMATQKMFSDLDKLELGDVFYLQVLGETLAYQVDAINVVLPYDTSFLGITESEDYCTLVTCTPFGVNTHRLLVRGTRIPYEDAEAIVAEKLQLEDIPTSTWEQQYIKGILLGTSAVIVLSVLSIGGICLQKRWCLKRATRHNQLRLGERGKYEKD
jgi:sortase A